MFEVSKNIKIALIFTIMPIALSFFFNRHQLYNISEIIMYSFFCAALLSLTWADFGNYTYSTAVKIGHFIGKYIAIIALFFVYIFTVLPTGILMKIVKRDRLLLKQPETQTYWKKYENPNSGYEYQF